MDLTPSQIKQFQERIFLWYEHHQRDLPWRKTRDPYAILVSEVMSQQTQIGRVIPKYEAWMKRFPKVTELAKASLREVLGYWSGLGYNSRALNLQKAAQVLVSEHSENSVNQKIRLSDSQKVRYTELSESSGKIIWPRTVEELMKLSGIGKYTARAIACFAFDEQIPVIDTNIRKVILTEFCQNHPELVEGSHNGRLSQSTEKQIEEIAQQILPQGRAYEWNQALMDYSSLALKGKKIPIPKQSHFLTSDRYFRGQTVKLLLDVPSISFTGLHDYFAKQNPIEPSRLEQIVQSMAKDGLIAYERGKLSLPA